MQLKSLSAILAAGLLVAASLACNAITGGALGGVQATANAALTQAASGGFSATANAALTQASSGNIAATADAAKATAEAAFGATPEPTSDSGVGGEASATPAGGLTGDAPSDVPIIKGDNQILFTSAEIVSYYTKADFATTVKFYKDEMPKNGWTIDSQTSVETNNAAVLTYTKDNRTVSISVTVDTNTKQTIVLATIATK